MQDTAQRGATRARRDRTAVPRAGRVRGTFARLVAALPDRAAGILNAVAFVSLGAALVALLVL